MNKFQTKTLKDINAELQLASDDDRYANSFYQDFHKSDEKLEIPKEDNKNNS